MLFRRRLQISRKQTHRTGSQNRSSRRRHRGDLGISPRSVCCGPVVEELEGRQMLAASATATVTGVAVPTLINLGRVASPGSVKPGNSPASSGPYTPSQVTTAYGVNLINFNGIVGNGAGQTIAIVDAYNDPNIVSDTATFNTRFGLPQFNQTGGPTFQVLNQTGGTTLPANTNTTIGDWDLEESLDVQWAHSMAPQANIILFESNTNNDPDMDAAEVTAANWPGVSVVSNSWGEGEFSGETSEDQYFQTPTGHEGVTFLASAGDSGSPAGYPSYSPYVVAVGGTNLQIQSNGTYTSESAWSDGGGGISTQESLPSYQAGLNGINGTSTTNRNDPDVAADADPASGVYVLDTWYEGQGGGYFQVGGTSLSSPLWAGFIAIANQGRALAGESTLNGYTQTLPMLYSLPSSDFHDVTTGSNGTYSAASGYDLVTGLGTPITNLLVPALAGYGTTAPSVSSPTSATVTENTSLAFSTANSDAINLTDPFSAGASDSLTLSVSDGKLTLGSTTGLTFTSGSNGSSSFTVSGTIANLNTDLDSFGLTYAPNSNYTGSDSLVVSLTDPGESLTGSSTVSITVQAPPPSVGNPAVASVNENSTLAFTGANAISVSDGGGTAEQMTLGVGHGTLSLSTTTGLTVTGNGTASVTLAGSLSNLNTDLATLTYTPTNNYTGSDALSISDKDTGTGLTGTGSVAITVHALAPAFNFYFGQTITMPENSVFQSPEDAPFAQVSDVGGTAESLTMSVSHGTLLLEATTGLTVTGNGTASVNVVGSLANINNEALVQFAYTPTANYVGTDTLSLSDTDTATHLTGTANVAITITGFTVTAPSSANVTENTPLTFSSTNGNQISVTDNYPGNTSDSLQVTVANGAVTLGSTTGLTLTQGGYGTASFTVSGTIGNLNAALNGVTYQPNANYTGSDSLALLLTDNLTTLSTSANVALSVNAISSPTFAGPSTATVSENGSLVFSPGNSNAISFTDNGAGSNSDTATLSVSNGTLTLGSTIGVIFTSGSNGAATFTVKGTVSNLNVALNGLKYQPVNGYAGSDSLAISVVDSTDNKSGSTSVAITVSPFAPSITAPAAASLNENTSFVFSGGNAISLIDANPGAVDSLALSVTHGTVTLSTTSGLTFTAGSNGTASFTVSGTVGNLNAALGGLTYTPTASYTGSDTLAISITDPGDSLSASKNVSLTINGLPAPTVTAPASATLLENSSLVFSSANGNAITVADSAAGSNSDSMTLSVTHGTLTLSTTSGLTFTGSNDTPSFTVTGTVASLNAALNGLTYTPTASYTGSDSLSVSITDPGDSESASKSVALTINAFSPPTVSAPGSASVVLNGSLVFSSANHNAITVADSGPGSGSDSLMLTVTHGTVTLSTTSGLTITGGGNGSATITVTGSVASLNAALSGLTYKPTTGYTGSDSLAISLKDSVDNLSASANVALSVNNSPPAITAPASGAVVITSSLVFSTANNNAISVADVNAGSSVEPLTLTSTDGTLTLGSTTGITFTSGANKSASMTINGTLANLNAALSGLTFTPAAVGSGTVVLSYTDVGNGLMATATINITVSKSGFKLVQGLPVSPPSSPAVTRASSVSAPTGGGTTTPAVTLTTANDTTDDSSLPPDALTQWQGLAAAVEMLIG